MPTAKLPRGRDDDVVSNAVLGSVLTGVKEDVAGIKQELTKINETLTIIGRMEVRQTVLIADIEKASLTSSALTSRVEKLEREVPPLVEARVWVVRGILAGVSMMLLGVASLVISPHSPTYLVVDGSLQSVDKTHIPPTK